MLHVLAGIAYDPQIRGILAVGVGVVVLMGSVYMLLATNTGNRLGFLIAATGFFGWMAIMGVIWWIYGIGLVGSAPGWNVVDFNQADLSQSTVEVVRGLDLSELPRASDGGVDYELLIEATNDGTLSEYDELLPSGWAFMTASNPKRGEAEATVAAQLPECSQCTFGITEPSQYKILTAMEVGGKEGLPDNPNRLDRIWTQIRTAVQILHPDKYAVVQVQKVIPQATQPGVAPPLPQVDPAQPVISVVMERDIGDRRFPPAVVTIGSLLIFGLLAWLLHQRELILEANLAEADKVKA